jgi:hypothetical protein
MSRRHHGRPHHHAPGASDGSRPAAGVRESAPGGHEAKPTIDRTSPAPRPQVGLRSHEPEVTAPTPPPIDRPAAPAPPAFVSHLDTRPTIGGPTNGAQPPATDRNGQCTAPQLRRFIKSRPYVPMHELRRRFAIDGGDDDVTPVRLDPGWVYVGLPTREGGLLGDLLKSGEIGYELSLDPRSPIVIGVYPMRPIPRG